MSLSTRYAFLARQIYPESMKAFDHDTSCRYQTYPSAFQTRRLNKKSNEQPFLCEHHCLLSVSIGSRVHPWMSSASPPRWPNEPMNSRMSPRGAGDERPASRVVQQREEKRSAVRSGFSFSGTASAPYNATIMPGNGSELVSRALFSRPWWRPTPEDGTAHFNFCARARSSCFGPVAFPHAKASPLAGRASSARAPVCDLVPTRSLPGVCV